MKNSIASLLIVGATLLPGPPARAATMILHNFSGGPGDGTEPIGSLTLSGSKLYGMTINGGSSAKGTIFSMNIDGTSFNLLHSFNGSGDGFHPNGSLTLFGSKLYGMTNDGGSGGFGTLFSMNTDGTGFGLLHSFTGGVGEGVTAA